MQHPAAPTAGRDPRLDFFRGLALVMIFINHVPGNMMEGVTSKNFGFSDAAEAFVLMSGMSAGLAYSNIYVRDRIHAIARILRRASRLYSVHLLTTVLAVIVLMAFSFTRTRRWSILRSSDTATRSRTRPRLRCASSHAL